MTEPESTVDTAPASEPYRVLARKYRPKDFDALIGQDALVRTLSNAFRSGRLAHAYMLSGVRGIGKTTTARIIARALNCIGPDGTGGPTAAPCGVCEHCRAIAEDRDVDVLEMDAASRTGVGEMRELIDGVRYRPASARYKVYIIDEVHMLSTQAFNALLKTLEEPPEHVRFVFATTEIRKVPITILSRCQRFDLRRVNAEVLAGHLAGIVEREGAEVSETALRLIARAADGSVRDGLSLLDQALSHTAGTVDETAIREMLGLADRTVTFDLLDAVLRGDIKTALDVMAAQYVSGADPAVVLTDMLELTHWLTRIKVVPKSADAPGVPEAERVRGRQMAEGLSMAEVTRAWQMLLKGLGETRVAPSPVQAAEMVLVRLAYAARLPTPAEALKALEDGKAVPAEKPSAAATPASHSGSNSSSPGSGAAQGDTRSVDPRGPGPGPRAALAEVPAPAAKPAPVGRSIPATFEEVADLALERGEAVLHAQLLTDVRLVHFEPGKIDLRLNAGAPESIPARLIRFLNENTATTWLVGISHDPGAPTLVEQRSAASAAKRKEVENHPLVREVLRVFPGATIEDVRPGGARARDTSPPEYTPEDTTEDAREAYDEDGD
jgi:DNA polymerase-3 subunit gamma/tau